MSPKKPSQATIVVELVRESEAELFHGADDVAYVRSPCGTHSETWPLRSKPARRWIARLFYQSIGTTPGAQALQDALLTLEGIAFFEGLLYDVPLRLANHEGAIYLDLGDDYWQAVEITREGWQVVHDPPVRFRRPRGMRPLPYPARGGAVDELREFVNIADGDWPLMVGWVVAALRPQGPFPFLALHGEQGSAKSTTERALRDLIDPNVAPLRSEPRNGRDLAIAANNGWVLAYDNLSEIRDWLSDAFCRIATGGGFSTRELYSDTDEVLIDAQRPLVMNGIAELATRPDLLDRAIPLYLPRLRRWVPEDEFFDRFHEARPRILGALLDAVSAAIANVSAVEFSGTVRMADFATWAIAAEPALGVEEGEFMRAYTGNRAEAVEITLEASTLTEPLKVIAAEGFEGTATELLAKLAALVEENIMRSDSWPGSPQALSADLGRLAPVLRRVGIEVERPPRRKGKRLIMVRTDASNSVTPVSGVTSETRSGPKGGTGDKGDEEKQPTSSSEDPDADIDVSRAVKRPLLGDEGYLDLLEKAFHGGHVTPARPAADGQEIDNPLPLRDHTFCRECRSHFCAHVAPQLYQDEGEAS